MRFALPLLLLATAAPAETLTLQQALDSTRAHAPALTTAHDSRLAAAARADEVRSALFPQLNANASLTVRTNNSVGGAVTPPGGNVLTPINVGLSLSQLVWDFQTYYRWKSSQAGALAAEDQERASLLSALASTRVAFFSARAAKSLVKVAHETLDNQQKHLSQVQGFVQVGTQPDIALAQAKSGVANATVQVINSENAYTSARAVLNQAMGVPRDTDYDVGDEGEAPIPTEDAPLEQLVDAAIAARPELMALESQVRAEELTLRATKGGYWPSLSVLGSASESGTDATRLGANASAGVVLSWPIFEGFLTPAQVREQEANLDSLHAQTEATRQQVRLQVDQARLQVRAAKGSLGAAAEAEEAARLQLKLAEGRYQAGAGSIIELSDAQVSFTAAAAQHVQAEYSLATARAQLLQALGQE